MATEAKINPNHESVKIAAHAWASKVLGFSDIVSEKILEADFTLMAAAFIPHATEEQLRGLVDWLYWVAMFDDRVDEGDFKSDTIGAANEILETLAILDDDHPEISSLEDPVRHILQVAWRAFSALRYKEHHRLYMMGLLKQINWMSSGMGHVTVQKYIEVRRGTIGGYPTFSYAE
ncbi:hypothetical protein ABW20_dc0109678 [Dactylellina cionopaga]|nr:hypothetical protein ABW20_dc0109678 [Dactylellina cionopaga]